MQALILDAHMRGPHLIGAVIAAPIKYVFFQ